MKSKFKKLMAAALVLCLMLALLPAGVLANSETDAGGASTSGAPVNEGVEPQGDDNDGGSTGRTSPTNITTAEVSNGTITLGSVTTDSDGKVAQGTKVTFTVEPNDGSYGVLSAKVSGTEDATEVTIDSITSGEDGAVIYVFTMPNFSVTISAVINPYKQVISSDGVYATNPSTNAIVGSTVTVITAAAPEGYELSEVWWMAAPGTTGDTTKHKITPTNGAYEFTMPNHNVTVGATFTEKQPEPPVDPTYTVTTSSSTGGTVTASPSTNVAKGVPVTLTVTPADGYWLKSLKIDGVEFANYVDWSYFWYYKYGTVSFTMPGSNVNVCAEFTNQLYVFTNYNGYRGEVEVLVKDDASGGEWVDTNFADTDDWVAFKPVAYTGFNIGAISVTGNWTGRSYDVDTWYWHNGWYYFQMPWENVTINVEFTDNSHAVSVKDASNGTLKTNTKWAVEDERVYITAVPDKGYELTWLSVKAEDGTKIDVYEALKEDTYYFFMPDQAVTVSAIFAYDYPDMPFTDVNSNSWYFNAIEFVCNKGIMQGVSSTKFGPNGTVTRGMLVTMLWRMAGEPYVGGGSFDDVASGSYYSTAVAWAAKNGIVDGYNSTRFGPNDAVTREQIATMLYRYAKWLGYSASGSSLAGYSDASSVSSWAKDAMGWAVKNSVVTGVTATKLNPTSSATRAETAQMFMNFYEYLN